MYIVICMCVRMVCIRFAYILEFNLQCYYDVGSSRSLGNIDNFEEIRGMFSDTTFYYSAGIMSLYPSCHVTSSRT